MSNLKISIFDRKENDGWISITPLEGERANDSTVLNPTGAMVYESVAKEGKSIGATVSAFAEMFPEQKREVIYKDVCETALILKELGVCELDSSEIAELVENPCVSRPGFHVMADSEIKLICELMREAVFGSSMEKVLYSTEPLSENRLEAGVVRGLHFHSSFVNFVFNDDQGRPAGLLALRDINLSSFCQVFGLMMVFRDDIKQRHDMAVSMLDSIADAVGRISKPTKFRFIHSVSSDPSKDVRYNKYCNWAELEGILADSGYVREALLKDEMETGVDAVYYARPAF